MNVVPPQDAAAKVTVLYVAVHLNLRSVKLDGSQAIHGSYVTCCKKASKHVQSLLQNVELFCTFCINLVPRVLSEREPGNEVGCKTGLR